MITAMSNKEKCIDIGTRLEVYWSSDECYYPGKVAKKRVASTSSNEDCKKRKKLQEEVEYFIQYDDGDQDWIKPLETKFNILDSTLDKKKQQHLQQQRKRIQSIQKHERILIWWPMEKEYFSGVLHEVKDAGSEEDENDSCSSSDIKPHRILYDDGDAEWTNLLHREFLIPRIDLQINSKLQIYWPYYQKYFAAKLIKIQLKDKKDLNRDNPKPHYVLYEDGTKEWTNLFMMDFKVVKNDKDVVKVEEEELDDDKDEDNRDSFGGTSFDSFLSKSDSDYSSDENEFMPSSTNRCNSMKSSQATVGKKAKKEKVTSDTLSMTHQSCHTQKSKQDRVKKLKKNTKLLVYFEKDNQYFSGTLVDIFKTDNKDSKPHEIFYDDGGTNITNLAHETFKLVEEVEVGSSLLVWWEGEKKYFPGKLAKVDSHSPEPHFITYEDGDEEWTDLNEREFRLLDGETNSGLIMNKNVLEMERKSETDLKLNSCLVEGRKVTKEKATIDEVSSLRTKSCQNQISNTMKDNFISSHLQTKQDRVKKLKKNTKLLVYFEKDNQYFSGTLVDIFKNKDAKHHEIFYDEGGNNITNLAHETFKLVEEVEVGSSLLVWWEGEKKYFPGKLAKVDSHSPEPHFIMYEDGDEEWTDLNERKFRLLDGETSDPVMNENHADVEKGRKSESAFKRRSRYNPPITLRKPIDALEDQTHKDQKKSNMSKADELEVGSWLKIWWSGEQKYYSGTLVGIRIDDQHGRQQHQIKYDDGNEEWTNLFERDFKFARKGMKRLEKNPKRNEDSNGCDRGNNRKVPTAVGNDKGIGGKGVSLKKRKKSSCENENTLVIKKKQKQILQRSNCRLKNFDHGTKLSNKSGIHRGESRPAKRRKKSSNQNAAEGAKTKPIYDEVEIAKELASDNGIKSSDADDSFGNDQSCLLTSESLISEVSPSNTNGVTSQTNFQSPTQDTEEKTQGDVAIVDDRVKQDEIPWSGACGICLQKANQPRATSCHHIFCKVCIRSSAQENTQTVCPVCNTNVAPKLQKYNSDHETFKPVEALNPVTAKVVFEFDSASTASLEITKSLKPQRIIDACNSLKRDEKKYKEYFWRFKGSKQRILRVGEGIKEGIPVEQISLETGEIIETFASGRKAFEKTGVSRCVIKRVLERRGKANGGGFFWRFQGETHEPWEDPEPTNLNPVEKLDFQTGDLLESFDSLADAKRALEMRSNSSCIREVCNGIRVTAKGYFWRWKGSTTLPDHMRGTEKYIQMRKKSGQLYKEFRTSREAVQYVNQRFKTNYCWSTICRWCRERSYEHAFYWKYHLVKKQTSENEAFLEKRLRIRQPSGDWIEGQLKSFDKISEKFEIKYDCGKIDYQRLADIEYKFKNDQGQKPIEQLDLETGKFLATYKSITDAANALNGSDTRITAVCKGRYKSSLGYFFRYKGSSALPMKPKGRKKIQQLCLKTGRVLATFDTITDAGKAVGITTPGISYCCNGRNQSKSAGGYGWQFAPAEV